MSADRDLTRIVRSWLHEDAYEDADRVLDLVLDQLDTTPQRRAWWPAWRFPHVNTATRIALAAVAVVALAFVGIRFLGPANTGGPGETASPTPIASPQALPGVADLAAGTYRVVDPGYAPRAFTVTVPAGWHTEQGFISKGDGIGRSPGATRELTLSTWIPSHVYEDACLRPEGDTLAALVETTTADEMVQAVADQGGHETTGPTTTTLAGYPAQRLEFAFAADYDLAACGDRFLRLWPDPGPDFGGGLAAYPGQRFTLYVVDIDGEAVIVVASATEDSSAAEVAELESVVDSIEFESTAP